MTRSPDTSPLDLERFLPYRLSVLSNRVSALIAKLYSDQFNLTIPEWRILAVLGRYGEMTATEVAARTAMDKVRVSRAIARLLDAGRLARRVDPQDRRRLTLEMTESGQQVYRQIVPLALSAEQRMLGRLTAEDLAAFDRLAAHLTQAVAAFEAELGVTLDGVDAGV